MFRKLRKKAKQQLQAVVDSHIPQFSDSVESDTPDIPPSFNGNQQLYNEFLRTKNQIAEKFQQSSKSSRDPLARLESCLQSATPTAQPSATGPNMYSKVLEGQKPNLYNPLKLAQQLQELEKQIEQNPTQNDNMSFINQTVHSVFQSKSFSRLEEAQHQHAAWTVANIGPNMYNICNIPEQNHYLESSITFHMSVLNNGMTFASLNAKRYEQLGKECLERVLMGVSRTIDFANGPQDLQYLCHQIEARDMKAVADFVERDILLGTCPIFAVTTATGYDMYSNWSPLIQDDFLKLHRMLYVLSGSGKSKVRIWSNDISVLSMSKHNSTLLLSIVPFMLFPGVFLHDIPRGDNYDIIATLQRYFAINSLGAVEEQTPYEKTVFNLSNPNVDNRVEAFVMKMVSNVDSNIVKYFNPMKSIRTLFHTAGIFSFLGLKCRVLERTDDMTKQNLKDVNIVSLDPDIDVGENNPNKKRKERILEDLRLMALQFLRNSSVVEIALGNYRKSQLYDIGSCRDTLYFKMTPPQLCLGYGKNSDIMEADGLDGLLEFIPNKDVNLAKSLGSLNLHRSYDCVYTAYSSWVICTAKLHFGQDRFIYALLLVHKVDMNDISKGILKKYIPNASSFIVPNFEGMAADVQQRKDSFKKAMNHAYGTQSSQARNEIEMECGSVWFKTLPSAAFLQSFGIADEIEKSMNHFIFKSFSFEQLQWN